MAARKTGKKRPRNAYCKVQEGNEDEPNGLESNLVGIEAIEDEVGGRKMDVADPK